MDISKNTTKKHGNSLENNELHHLYKIDDNEEQDIFKYGISGEPLLFDGSSRRANKQVKSYNLIANKDKFSAKVLITDSEGRENALEIEDNHIKEYERKHGHKPRGNL